MNKYVLNNTGCRFDTVKYIAYFISEMTQSPIKRGALLIPFTLVFADSLGH